MTFFFLCSDPVDFNFLKIGHLATLSCPHPCRVRLCVPTECLFRTPDVFFSPENNGTQTTRTSNRLYIVDTIHWLECTVEQLHSCTTYPAPYTYHLRVYRTLSAFSETHGRTRENRWRSLGRNHRGQPAPLPLPPYARSCLGPCLRIPSRD
jgi:hypothetical protein